MPSHTEDKTTKEHRNQDIDGEERLASLNRILRWLGLNQPKRADFDSLDDFRATDRTHETLFRRAHLRVLDARSEILQDRRDKGLTGRALWTPPEK